MKNGILVILFIALGFFAWRVWQKEPSGENYRKTFSLSQDANIVKIIMNSPQFEGLSLIKTDTGWTMNTQVKADETLIEQLIETCKRMEVIYPVEEKMKENTIKEIKKAGIEVFLYNETSLVKSFWVGKPTNNDKGTYFYDSQSGKVLVCAIPNFIGFLDQRFAIDQQSWRDRTIFNTELGFIKKLELNYPSQPEKGFELNVINKDSFNIKSISGKSLPIEQLQTQKLLQYLTFYKKIHCEGYDANNILKDSLLTAVPYAEIQLTDFDNKQSRLILYQRGVNRRSKSLQDNMGKSLTYDVDRYWAIINKNKEIAVVQQYTVNKLLVSYNDFYNLQTIE